MDSISGNLSYYIIVHNASTGWKQPHRSRLLPWGYPTAPQLASSMTISMELSC